MAGQYETLAFRKEGNLGRLELTRLERLNAVAMTGARELLDVAKEIAGDSDLRMLAITGQGRAFSTRIDLKDLAADKIDLSYFDMWDSASSLRPRTDKG